MLHWRGTGRESRCPQEGVHGLPREGENAWLLPCQQRVVQRSVEQCTGLETNETLRKHGNQVSKQAIHKNT